MTEFLGTVTIYDGDELERLVTGVDPDMAVGLDYGLVWDTAWHGSGETGEDYSEVIINNKYSVMVEV